MREHQNTTMEETRRIGEPVSARLQPRDRLAALAEQAVRNARAAAAVHRAQAAAVMASDDEPQRRVTHDELHVARELEP